MNRNWNHLTWPLSLLSLQQQIGWWQHFSSSPAAVFAQHGSLYLRQDQILSFLLDVEIFLDILHHCAVKLPCDSSVGVCTTGECDWIDVVPFCHHNYTTDRYTQTKNTIIKIIKMNMEKMMIEKYVDVQFSGKWLSPCPPVRLMNRSPHTHSDKVFWGSVWQQEEEEIIGERNINFCIKI